MFRCCEKTFIRMGTWKIFTSLETIGRDISVISARLNILRKYCPSEFAKRPRALDSYSKFKAT